jgi:hypothetical protein
MSVTGDALLARAAAVIENARDIRTETQRVVDAARLERLHRELITKMLQIDRLIARPRKKTHRLL